MNKVILMQISIIILLLNSFLVFPADDDFLAAGDSLISACACEVRQSKIYVTNTGILTGTYQLQTSGSGARWTAFAPESFVLTSGGTAVLDEFINIPCSSQGRYDIKTSIKNNYGTEKVLSQVVDVKKCDNLLFGSSGTSKASCPCTPVIYEFQVTNTAGFPEIYTFSVDGYAQYITLSEAAIVLEPGQTKKIFLYLNTPCDLEGELNFNFYAYANKNDLRASLQVSYSTLACFDYNAIIPLETRMCAGEIKNIPITIYNNATLENSFHMTISPDFVDLLTNGTSARTYAFKLLPKATAGYTLIVDTNKTGTYDMDITFQSKRGRIEKRYTSKLIIEKCHDAAIAIQPEKIKAIECDTAKAYIWIENRGTNDTSFQLELIAPENVSIESKESLDFRPGESKTLELVSDICKPGQYEAKVIATTQFNLSVSDFVTFEVISSADASRVDLETYKVKAYYEDKNFIFRLKNKGIINNSYQAWAIIDNTVENITWIDLNPKAFSLGVNETIDLILRVSPLFNQTNRPIAYVGNHNLSIFIGTDTDIYENNIQLQLKRGFSWPKIPMNWIWVIFIFLLILLLILFILLMLKKDVRERPKKPRPMKIQRKSKPLDWKKIWNYLLVMIYTALIGLAFVFFPAFALYIIIGLLLLILWIIAKDIKRDRKPKEKAKDKNLFYYLLILLLGLILIIAAFIYLFSLAPATESLHNVSEANDTTDTQKEAIRQDIFEQLNYIYKENLDGTFPYQIWDMNTNKTIDLSKHYIDPDNDRLGFTYIPMDNISVDIDGQDIRFIPQKDWFGIRYTRITASDGTSNVTGPNMTLIVKEPGVYDEFQKSQFEFNTFIADIIFFIRSYWIYFLIGVIMLLVIIMFMENDDTIKK